MADDSEGKLTPPDEPSYYKPPDSELRAAFNGPAILSNRFFVSILPNGVRLAFAEQNGTSVEPQFRTAVVLSFQDGIALSDLLSRVIRENVDNSGILTNNSRDDGTKG